MSLADLLEHPLAQVPERTALAFADNVTYSFADLEGYIDRCVAALQTALTRAGERIAVLDSAGALTAVAVVAAVRAGGSAALLNTHLTTPELLAALTTARCTAVGIATGADAEKLRQVIDGTVLAENDINIAAATASSAFPSTSGSDAEAVVLFTSGTTGTPKAVAVAGATLEQRIDALALPLDPAIPTVRMICVPVFHVGGLVGLLRNLRSGVTTVVQPRFDAGEWLRLVEEHRVSGAFVVPTMLRRILDHPDLGRTDLRSLTAITYGAAPAPVELIRRAVAVLPWVAFSNSFGQTETLGGICSLTGDDHRNLARIGSVGRPLPGVRVRIVDDRGEDVAAGTVGELWVDSAQNAVPGWTPTGDLVRQDNDGYLWVEGRTRDLINRGGEKFTPDEIEAVLRSHPGISDVAVAGVPDADLGERVGVVVVCREPLGLEDLRAHCRPRLARYKLPELMATVGELPVNALGKVVRARVVGLLSACRDRAGAR